jgi:hypothetical protein
MARDVTTKAGEKKRPVTLYFSEESYRRLAHLAVDEDKSLPELLRGWVLERAGLGDIGGAPEPPRKATSPAPSAPASAISEPPPAPASRAPRGS